VDRIVERFLALGLRHDRHVDGFVDAVWDAERTRWLAAQLEACETLARRPPERVEKTLGFVTHPTWQAYVATYIDAFRVCRAYVDGHDERFGRLLREPLVPGNLASTLES
jgi:hypothetical protein